MLFVQAALQLVFPQGKEDKKDMRDKFGKQLDELNDNLIHMGSLCEDCISQVAMAMAGKNQGEQAEQGEKEGSSQQGGQEMPARLLEKVYHTDSEIDQMERDIEALCLRLLLQQQPVASDLRLVSSALKMISDMERIGDQCSDIADIVKFLDDQNALGLESCVDIQDMAASTMCMVTKAIDSFVSKNLVVARGVMQADDQVDSLFDKVKKEISALIAKHPDQGEALLDLLMIAKYFERIGDHATNIAEWVEFSITGEHEEKTKYQNQL